jgi:hypothetical protein
VHVDSQRLLETSQRVLTESQPNQGFQDGGIDALHLADPEFVSVFLGGEPRQLLIRVGE